MDDDRIREVVEGGKRLYDPPERRWHVPTGAIVLVTAVLLILVAGALLTFVVFDNGDDAIPTTTTASDASEVSGSDANELVTFVADPPALYYPTLLPEGMELCEATLGRPISGDVFCDRDDPNRWVRVTAVDGIALGGEAIEDRPGITLIDDIPPEVGVTALGGFGGFRLQASGMDVDTLIDVAASLPIADPEILAPAAEEALVILDAGTLAQVVGAPSSEIQPDPAGGFTVYAGDLTLYTTPTFEGATDRGMVAGLVKPILVSPEHGLVVGADPQPGESVQAVWIQGGRWWNLRMNAPVGEVEARATAMEAAIAALPTAAPAQAGAPSAVAGAAMVPVSTSGELLMYGGVGPTGASEGTYLLDGTDHWTDVTTDDGPGPRFDHAMAYIPTLDAVLVFGGTRSTAPAICRDEPPCTPTSLGDTWLWDVASRTWTEVVHDGDGPPARRGARMVWDPQRQAVVMVGGELAVTEWVFPLPTANDTWIFDPATKTWSELEVTSTPRPVARPGVVYDPTRDRVLMFGGESGGAITDDTVWALEGSGWSEVQVDGAPPARLGHAFVWDDERDRGVLTGGVGRVLVPIVGGTQAQIAQLPDVWTFDPANDTWTEHDVADTPIFLHRAVAVDGSTGTLVAFGGELFEGRYEMGSSSYAIVEDLDRLSLGDLTWR